MGWWKTAKPGDKVVCVYAPLGSDDGDPSKCDLSVSGVYEVREIFDHWYFQKVDGCPGVTLVECGHRYSCDLFRPVQTKSTDTGMAILKRILERPHQRIEEDA